MLWFGLWILVGSYSASKKKTPNQPKFLLHYPPLPFHVLEMNKNSYKSDFLPNMLRTKQNKTITNKTKKSKTL